MGHSKTGEPGKCPVSGECPSESDSESESDSVFECHPETLELATAHQPASTTTLGP